jgi:hypothetical protein
VQKIGSDEAWALRAALRGFLRGDLAVVRVCVRVSSTTQLKATRWKLFVYAGSAWHSGSICINAMGDQMQLLYRLHALQGPHQTNSLCAEPAHGGDKN